MAKKSSATKIIVRTVHSDKNLWTVHYGTLKRAKGNPGAIHLFKVVAEKLPITALKDVKKDFLKEKWSPQGVYIAHDSMGFPRYIGRGNIFNRLESRINAQKLELAYFSFYLVSNKKHEREIETILIRAAGTLLEFNSRKKRVGILPGAIMDFEAGTFFYERHYKKGKKVKK